MTYEVVLARTPFKAKGRELLDQLKAGDVFYGSQFSRLSPSAQHFLRYLLRIAPAKRPSASEALEHLWLHSSSEARSDSLPDASTMMGLVELAHQPQGKRICLGMIASELPLHEQAQFETKFNALDTNKSGSISANEFCGAMSAILGMEKAAAQDLFQQLAASNSEITYSEFISAGLQSQAGKHEKACRAAFHRITSRHDFLRRMSRMSTALSVGVSEMEALVKEADTSSKGTVSYEEFLSFIDLPPSQVRA